MSTAGAVVVAPEPSCAVDSTPVKGLDFVRLEWAGEVDAKNLAKAAGSYQSLFVQGK